MQSSNLGLADDDAWIRFVSQSRLLSCRTSPLERYASAFRSKIGPHASRQTSPRAAPTDRQREAASCSVRPLVCCAACSDFQDRLYQPVIRELRQLSGLPLHEINITAGDAEVRY